MQISLNWLQEFVDLSLTPEELAEVLTMAGFEVEGIEDRRTWAEGVVVGKVLSRQSHPNADKLSVCEVEIGAASPLNIVCGAANVCADIYVPVAPVGTYLPAIDLKIRSAKLRGVRSEGMICSLAELGLEKESAGIHIIEQGSLDVGSDVRPLLGLDDVVLDLTATANRADALSMVGVAREVAALLGNPLKLPAVPEISFQDDAKGNLGNEFASELVLKVAESQACPAYIGTAIAQVKIAPSPSWLQQRLQSAGIRPINNVVDVTNYVLLEWGQPLHAFDRDALLHHTGATEESGSLKVGVRFARSGEVLTTLDGMTRTLQSQNLLITANDRAVALAGVMGGQDTEVHAETQNLILEAALFEPPVIRRSARAQGLRTEASARYERGINQAGLEIACRRALALIVEIAGGIPIVQKIADTRPAPSAWTRSIELRLERVNQLLGPVEVESAAGEGGLALLQGEEVETILTALGCVLEPGPTEQTWRVTIPPYRYRDLEREIDLIEEIARLYGYNHFCDTLPTKTEPGYLSAEQALTRKLREVLRAAGLTEIVHYSLVKPGEEKQVLIANPLLAEYSALRTDLLSGLIDAFQYNLEQGNGVLSGFEIGRVFWREEEGLQETDLVAGILGGDRDRGRWTRSGQEQSLTWYEAKGVLESVFHRLNLVVEYQPDRQDMRLHPGRTASLWIRGNRLGTFGQLHPQLRQERGFPEAVYCFELDLDLILMELDRRDNLIPLFSPYAPYPATDRDLAFFAPTTIVVAELERAIHNVVRSCARGKTEENLLESVELFDEYQGENVPAGQRSLAFRLVYRACDRTLTDADVEPIHQQIRDTLVEKFGVNLRS